MRIDVVRAALGLTLAAVLVPAAVQAQFKEAPYNFETAPGRLPKTVVPVDYRIAIVPNVQARTFSGTETIALDVRKPATTIVFNTLDMTLHGVRLDGRPVAKVDTQNAKQLTTLTLAKSAPVGRHTLTLAYDGKIQSAPAGLFAQPYRTSGGQGVMLSTQFEATDARRMFPCWDEPSFRATFQLSATVPAAWATVSNMPAQSRTVNGALATTTFRRSPKMPSYLVEFSAGDLSRITASSEGIEHGVWTVAGRGETARTALANSQVILNDYNAYFGYKFPLPKLDHIAVPGGFQGAMENWGAITYNDQTLLDPPDAGLDRKQTIFSIMAHEMAHQWNGDLVTMGWWDDIWLNESFASWMSAKETALRNPTWNWWEREDGSKETAMNADARINSHAIQQHVSDELQAEASFDAAITYNKGQAFLRMLEAYLGDDTFRAGIRDYIKAHAFSNATSADLWNGLSEASKQDVAKVAASWTEQPGFPLVTVNARCDASGNRTLSLAQHRFLVSGTDPNNSRWSIPMRIRSGAQGTPQTILFVNDGQTVKAGRCSEPLSANADVIGFYRVKYDDATLATNRAAFGTLPNGDRIALLDDQWALARAGQAPLSTYLALAASMGNDLDARAWDQIAGPGGREGIGALPALEVDERGKPGHDAFVTYARNVVRPVAAAVGWDAKPGEDPSYRQLRAIAYGDLGSWGDPAVVAEARARFAKFLSDRSSLTPEQQGIVLPIVAANADQATFDRLVALAKGATDEVQSRRFLFALAAVRDPKLAQQVLEIALSPAIPPQASFIRSLLVYGVAANNPQLAWTFFQQHVDQLLANQSEFQRALFLAQAVPTIFWRGAPLDEIQAWMKPRVPASLAQFEARGLETAREAAAEQARLDTEADAFIAKR